MATYIYETIPPYPDAPVSRFEIQQSMKDDALKTHPETGEPVRRVITGGFGYMTKAGAGNEFIGSVGGDCGEGACGMESSSGGCCGGMCAGHQ